MIDAPGGAMRPVDPDAVANFAAEQFIAGHAEHLGLDVEQSIFDRAERLAHHAAGPRAGRCEQLDIDALVRKRVLPDHARRKPLNYSADAGRAKTFVEFAPAGHAL